MKRAMLACCVVMLVACKDRGVAPKRAVQADSADHVYAGMSTTISRNGLRTSIIEADSAWNYSQRQVFDLKGMTVTMFDSNGNVLSKITSDKGVYSVREQNLDSRGHVVATSSGGKILKTEHLIFNNRLNQISSDTAFTSTSPQGNISGAHFYADPGFKSVTINKMKGAQKGKGIALPGQRGGGAP